MRIRDAASLAGEVVTPGEEGYDQGIRRWSDSISLPAKYVVYPKTAEDIATALKYAESISEEVAICGGGHSWSGASSTKGLLIYLGKYFNTARCDPDAKLIYVGGGALWSTVDDEALKYGLATVGGTVNHTGVAGLTLGGGHGFLSGRYGLSVDNLAQVTVVLASGEVVTANESEHSDLFWGCRGGGGNFGVVTEFVFRVHPQRPKVFFTTLIYPAEKATEVVNAAETWYETITPDEGAFVVCARPPPAFQPSIIVLYFYNGSPEDGKKAARLFYEAGPVHEQPDFEIPYPEINTKQNAMATHGGRKYFKGQTVPKLTPELLNKISEEIMRIHSENPDIHVVVFGFEFWPKSQIMAIPPEATAFGHRTQGRESLVFTGWNKTETDLVAQAEVRKLSALVKDMCNISTSRDGLGYINYASEVTDVRDSAAYFGQNYPRLRQVKKKYDPKQVFGKWFPIVPADE